MKKIRFLPLMTVFVGLLLLGVAPRIAPAAEVQTLEQFSALPADVQEKLKEQYLAGQGAGQPVQAELNQEIVEQPVPLDAGPAGAEAPERLEAPSVSPLEEQYRGRYQSDLAKDLSQFGYNLFAQASDQVSQNVVPSSDYIVVPGDQMRIRLWGAAVDVQYVSPVDADGTINVPKIGVIPVAGERLGALEGKIKDEALKYMQGINVSIALEKLHSVEVYVIGEVVNPGLHVVPAFSSIFKGLQAAGGIKKSGSLRRIGLYRDNRQQSNFDLYELIFSGDRSGDQLLRDQDVIFVPHIGGTVAIAGAVHQSGIFELAQERTANQVLDYAGGVLPNAYSQSLYIKRYDRNNAFQVVDLRSHRQDVLTKRVILSGDLLEVPYAPIAPAKVVILEGHVKAPQTFTYTPGLRLGDVLRGVDDLKPEALTEYALLHRYNEQSTRYAVQKFPLERFLKGDYDLDLRPYDKIEILSRDALGIRESVAISGAVWKAGSYDFRPGMTVADLLALAGGIKEHEYIAGNAYLYRYDPASLQYNLRRFDLELALKGEKSISLQAFDRIEMLSRTDYNFKEPVRIEGAVRKPGEYVWSKSMTVRDLVDMAGGAAFGAQPERLEVSRVVIEKGESRTTHFTVDLRKQAGMALQPYDYVNMPVVKDATKVAKVEITGEVLYPGTYSIEEGEHLSDVIRRAGGYTEQAYFYGARFTSEQSREIQQRSIDQMVNRLQMELRRETAESGEVAVSGDAVQTTKLQEDAASRLLAELKKIRAEGRVSMRLGPLSEFAGSMHDFMVHDGDRLFVPLRPGFVSVVGSVYTPNSFVYQAGMSIGDYLEQSGGPTKTADQDYIYLQRANGEVFSIQQSGMFSGFYSQEPMPGDTIVVMEDLERVPELRLIKDVTEIVFRIATTAGIAFAI